MKIKRFYEKTFFSLKQSCGLALSALMFLQFIAILKYGWVALSLTPAFLILILLTKFCDLAINRYFQPMPKICCGEYMQQKAGANYERYERNVCLKCGKEMNYPAAERAGYLARSPRLFKI